jgi:hypothetical protein
MLPILDPAITKGMNTVDDPKRLQQGECSLLVNMIPGDPPRPRNGCTGALLVGTTNYRFIPPGISFEYSGVVYVVIWVNDSANPNQYHLLAIKSDLSGTFYDLGTMEITLTDRLFDFLKVHGCVYCAVAPAMSQWKSAGTALNHKVIESNAVVRDMCISVAGTISAHALTVAGGTMNTGKWVEYASQYVRRTDAAAFGAGGAISGIILPPGITATYRPQRIDTLGHPGVCIGIEDITKRHTVELIETLCDLAAAGVVITNSGFANYTGANLIDGNTATKAFDANTGVALGSTIKIDFGSGNTRCLQKVDLYTNDVGINTNEFKLQYSDDATTWVDASVATVLENRVLMTSNLGDQLIGGGNLNEANCQDGNIATKGFDLASVAADSWIDFHTEGMAGKVVSQVKIFVDKAGCSNIFKLQYYNFGTSTWVDASANTVVSEAGWNTIVGTAITPFWLWRLYLVNAGVSGYNFMELEFYVNEPGWYSIVGTVTTQHRYWRLYLNNAGANGPDYEELRCYGKVGVTLTILSTAGGAQYQGATHQRISRTLEQDTEELARGATKFFVCDLPILTGSYDFVDVLSNAALEGEANQLITGYSVAPPAAFIEYSKGRVFLMAPDGKVYYSESPGGDGGADQALAVAYPQAWSSLFKPTLYFIDCDYVDGLKATGMRRLSDDLFFFKEKKIFALFGGDPTASARTLISERIGCSFPYTVTQCELNFGQFGSCILFLSNEGPMILQQGGRMAPFSDFKIKELWPDRERELYGELDTHYDWIIHNCTAGFFRNIWWVMYRTYGTDGTDGENKIFGYYFEPNSSNSQNSVRGAFEFRFASTL